MNLPTSYNELTIKIYNYVYSFIFNIFISRIELPSDGGYSIYNSGGCFDNDNLFGVSLSVNTNKIYNLKSYRNKVDISDCTQYDVRYR